MLRQHFRHRAFVVGARDVIESRDVYESFEATTAAAEDVMATAVRLADAEELAVMAVGRLGSGEFDLLSDADVLFVCGEDGDRIALTKSAEQMMHALAAYTQDGTVFPVDARLRPRGGEGELLSTPSQLASYFEHEAQAWEALMYTKLRFLAGSQTQGERAKAMLETLFERFAADPGFSRAVREMRTKLETAEAPGKSFKSSPGGIYDIDFITSYLLVKHGVADKRGSLRDRLWRCVDSGVLDKSRRRPARSCRGTGAHGRARGTPGGWTRGKVAAGNRARQESHRKAHRANSRTRFSGWAGERTGSHLRQDTVDL